MRPIHHVSQSSLKMGARVSERIDINLIRMLRAGPLVSLNGSPMVSPTTQALCVSLPFPPYELSFSMYFFELSQAPPALDIVTASTNPLAIAPPSKPPRHLPPISKPTAIGERIARTPGRTISCTLAVVQREMHALLSHSTPGSPWSSPLISLNCLCTSTMIDPAAFLTESMVKAPNKYGSMAPIITPDRMRGSVKSRLIVNDPTGLSTLTFSEYALMNARAVRTALPIANPFPVAAVVLPRASRASVLSLTSSSQSGVISAIPPALSAMGPYASVAKVTPRVESIPTAAIETP
mmetsp:Transcript_4160/g.10681  ORF Transcript_4160/g.10681 Transcript_4160/m.10681 type:complete len:294 (-) Transcript_4160:1147-2028(-)